MTPYYSDEAVTIYHGDCREGLSSIAADAVVTDPPYGIHARYRPHAQGGSDHANNGGVALSWDSEYPHEVVNALVDREIAVVAFGSAQATARDLAAFSTVPRMAVWAPSFRLGMASRDGLAYRWSPIYLWRVRTSEGTVRDVFDDPTEAGNWWNHPATKPLRLLTRLVALTEGSVLDPYMGSGTTLRAAKDLGRKAIGIEIEERYCEIAARRLSQEVLAL